MELYHYPLVCWDLAGGAICGVLVGTRHQVVETSIKKMKSMLADQLRRDMEAGHYFAEPRIVRPSLEVVEVELTPAYRSAEGVYPTAEAIRVPVPALWGRTEEGTFECFLPLLKESFYYYSKEQLNLFVRHFAKDAFSQMAPEEVHRYLLASKPWLEVLTVRVTEGMRKRRASPGPSEGEMELAKVAERFPPTRSVRRSVTVLPEVAWERADLVSLVADKILKEEANLLVVGDHGVGKSSILMEAARKAHRLSKGPGRQTLLFWRTSPHRLMAGAKYLGDWQRNCEALVGHLADTGGVLWIADLVELLRVGGEGPEDSMAAFMASYIRRGKLRMVGEATPRELEAVRMMLPGLLEPFQTVLVEEMERARVQRVLESFKVYAERNLDVTVEGRALETAYRLLNRFVRYESFPGKAMKFLGQCLNQASLKERALVDEGLVLQAFVERSGMAELFLRDDKMLDEAEMRAFFGGQILGQEEALERVYEVVKVFKAGLSNPSRPIATLIFAGPTGVGKTACVRALAKYFFGKGQRLDPLIRLDMSEFQHPMQIERLIGSGRGEPGVLVRQVRERPFGVILLDEIEKAHGSFFDTLLALLDEGMLSDAYGRLTDFRNTIIIMTSNLGVERGRSIGFGGGGEGTFSSAVRAFFRPEFFNRIDAVVTFKPLTAQAIRLIALKELAALSSREGLARKGVRLVFSEAVVDRLAKEGFDPDHGARPLQRAMEGLVVSALARYMLKHPEVQKKGTLLTVDLEGEEVVVRGG